jgi:ribosome-binding protein aMBF1 (putative translation factor)
MSHCMVCGKEDLCKFTIIISPAYSRLKVCGDCMNDYGNGHFDKLTEKLERREPDGSRKR